MLLPCPSFSVSNLCCALGEGLKAAVENSLRGILSPFFISEIGIQSTASFSSIFTVTDAAYPLTSHIASWQEIAYGFQFAWQKIMEKSWVCCRLEEGKKKKGLKNGMQLCFRWLSFCTLRYRTTGCRWDQDLTHHWWASAHLVLYGPRGKGQIATAFWRASAYIWFSDLKLTDV